MLSLLEEVTGRAARPDQNGNQQDAQGVVSRESLARDVAEFHRRGLSRRKYRDLTAEKYMLHVDGEGDGQWADLYQGERVVIPSNLSGIPRAQNNLLRPMLDNATAYHTTMPFRFAVDTKQDREARDRALIDQALINYLVQEQQWNALFAEAFYMAGVYGNCPVHAYWRDDMASDPYEPLYNTKSELLRRAAEELGVSPEQLDLPRRGFVDCWVGDPFDTVYHASAKRGSVQSYTYGRTLPAEMVRRAFPHVPQAQTLEGSNKLPSASRFQRTTRKWLQNGRDVHGTAAVYSGEASDDEELIALVCRETAPKIDQDWPDGRLTVVALKGSAATDREEAAGGIGEPVLLHDGPLPAGRFSSVRVYSTHRFDDVLGKPYVGDLDDDQVLLNQLLTLLNEHERRATRAPLVTAEGVNMETAIYDEDAILELDPSVITNSAFKPQFLEVPARHLPVLQWHIEYVERSLFRKGGWQAASRGESHAGDPAAKVVALARADDTIHGPTNQRFRETLEDYAQLCWALAHEYMDVPWVIDTAGDELAHLAEPYIDRSKLSEKPPQFTVVSGFGATPESKAQQLIQLVTTQGADGRPLMGTEEMRKQWPDNSTYPQEEDPERARRRRPKVLNSRIRQLGQKVHEAYGLDGVPMADPRLQAIAQQALVRLDMHYPLLMDDDIQLNLDTLSAVTQDETELPVVRQIAAGRQALYFQWLAAQQQAAMEAAEGGQPDAEDAAPPGAARQATTEQAAGGSAGGPELGGTPTSEAMNPSEGTVAELTHAATAGA